MAWSESTPVRGIPRSSASVGRNYVKTAMLMAFLIALLAIGGQVWGGSSGMLLFGAIGLVINFVSYWFSDRIALMAHRAQPVTREQLPQLYEIVERLTRKAGLPMPKLYVIPSETPNAFATGRNPSHAAVAVTEGILRLLDWRELEGVLAHELSHVQNRDILISTIAAAVAGIISSLGHAIQWGAMFGGLSRRDDEGRGGGPDPLADALLKLERGNEAVPYQFGGPATAHLFIVHPFGGTGGAIMKMLSTHPPVEERIRRLRAMKRGMRYA